MRSAVAVLVAAAIVGCSAPAGTVATSAPTTSAPVNASTAATPTASAPSVAPSRGPVTDIGQVFRPIAASWRPTTTTAVVASANDDATLTLVAVPISTASVPTPLVTFRQSFWSIRDDGTAIAVTIATDRGPRVAIYEPVAGASRWLTDPGTSYSAPVWSKDGASLFYVVPRADLSGAVYRVDATGENRKELVTLERLGELLGMTPDARGLVWSLVQAGGSAEILDLATLTSRHLEDVARIVSWRSQQPRALLSVGGCCAGRPGGALVAWDDVSLTSRVVAARGAQGDPAWGGGAWDPGGTRIAAVRFDATSPYAGSLVILDAGGVMLRAVGGTGGAAGPVWLDEGVVFTSGQVGDYASDLTILRTSDASPVSLFNDARIQRFTVVRP